MKSTLRLFALACLAWSSLALARVDINTASSEELQTLKGIGAQRAEKKSSSTAISTGHSVRWMI